MVTTNGQLPRVLITGATGFIGSHLAETVLQITPDVTVLYRSTNPVSYFASQQLATKVRMIYCDMTELLRLHDIITRYDITHIFHLAAQAIVPTAYRNPYETIQSNTLGTSTILEAVRISNPHIKVVIASTDKAYGYSTHAYKENDPLMPTHPYDASKAAADLITTAYAKTYGLKVVTTRFGNVYGEGDIHYSRIIPGIFAAICQKRPLIIRSDGKMIREYVYVKDVVRGYIQLMEQIDNFIGQVVNFGSNYRKSVLEVIKDIESVLSIPITYEITNTQKNEIPAQSLDWDKARTQLGWEPTYSLARVTPGMYSWYQWYFSHKVSSDGLSIQKSMVNTSQFKGIVFAQ